MRTLLARAVLAAIVVGWFVTLRPVVLGGPASYVLVGGQSMEPTIHAGSLVIAFRADEYTAGEIVVYRVPDGDPAAGRNVIHRIVGGSTVDGFVMQGDNAPSSDIWQPTGGDVLGRATVVLPGIADLIVFARSPIVVASLTAALAAYAVLSLLGTRLPEDSAQSSA
jgi:signal peptidase